jgi:hypothetical protein
MEDESGKVAKRGLEEMMPCAERVFRMFWQASSHCLILIIEERLGNLWMILKFQESYKES